MNQTIDPEIQRIVSRYKFIQAIRKRERDNPRACFVLDDLRYYDGELNYFKNSKSRICLECYWWFEHITPLGCQKPFGLKHLIAIVKNFLWRLRGKFRPLDSLYCYHYKLMRRRS